MKRQKINLREITDYDNPIAGVDVLSMDYLIGQIFAHSELLGLGDRQLRAYKASLRRMLWDWFNSHFDNPTGLADISQQARTGQGIEHNLASTTGKAVYATNFNTHELS